MLSEQMERDATVRTLEGLRVLVVDDDGDTRDLLTIVLEMQGATILTAPTALEGLKLVESSLPNVVVCDITLPDLDGYEFLRRVRSMSDALICNVPAIAMTGLASDEDRAKALEAGYQMHMAKPVDPYDLAAHIAKTVNATEL